MSLIYVTQVGVIYVIQVSEIYVIQVSVIYTYKDECLRVLNLCHTGEYMRVLYYYSILVVRPVHGSTAVTRWEIINTVLNVYIITFKV